MGRDGEDGQVARRIVAMVMSLASLALCAASAGWPVRWLLLFVLRRAEAIARLYALEAGVPALAPLSRRRPCADARAELQALARRLCVLAQLLRIAAARDARAAVPGRGRWRAAALDEPCPAGVAGRGPAGTDTS